MFGIEAISSKTALAIAAAIGYAIATLLMKLMAESPSAMLVAGICAMLVITVAAEISLLRQVDFGLAYIAIIATETMLVLAVTFFLGEPLSTKEMLGGALVVAGASLVSF